MTRCSVVASTAVASVLFLITASGAFAQQSKLQQSCLNNINKSGANVAKQQGKEHYACLRAAGKNDLTITAEACLTADVKGRLLKRKGKTNAAALKYCVAPLPDFGYTGASNTNFAASQAEIDLIGDVFGDLDAAVINCDVNKPGCVCQQKVLKSVDKLAATKIGEFLRCKKASLKAGATSIVALSNCVEDAGTIGSIAADTKLRISKALTGLKKSIDKGCEEDGVTAGSFPGSCSAFTGDALRDCLDVLVECRVCQMINDVDGMWVDCDTFDNGVVDASCTSGTGPAPTPTPEPEGGEVFRGALLPSTGLFTYNATPGLAGADAACNANFAGTHACPYAELQAAQTAGDLVGAQDINGNTVTQLWVIDGTLPDNQQCFSSIVWNYQTAHTGVGGTFVTLNNPAGTLSAPSSGLNCGAARWVACCL